ncbi:hypothetical protein Cob_v006245 [Colletotrichum orbiculare MAFF 240422]|uniref:Uncharacterized protein n=1 Tax=Colletotrichum orbiculare (strain 104-T / ATCC 96160 / CBS 514.97 / LARS 414 / MAFF 240422) TaxID=1213857 RepID=N4VK93_COLOR|nr:hypothetical protein Cob_v006245 [Colletotrichum orbiculare MAFF 240422]
MTRFHPVHILPMLLATIFTLASTMPMWDASGAIRAFGLPDNIATSKEAHAAFVVYGARMTAWGLAMWTFYLRGNLKAVDTMLALTLYMSAVDCYVCFREGVPDKAIFRLASGLLVSSWGIFGVTSRFSRA